MFFVFNIESNGSVDQGYICFLFNSEYVKKCMSVYWDYLFSWEGVQEGDFVNQVQSLCRYGKGGCHASCERSVRFLKNVCLWVGSVDPSNGNFTSVGSRRDASKNSFGNNPVDGPSNWSDMNVISFL